MWQHSWKYPVEIGLFYKIWKYALLLMDKQSTYLFCMIICNNSKAMYLNSFNFISNFWNRHLAWELEGMLFTKCAGDSKWKVIGSKITRFYGNW